MQNADGYRDGPPRRKAGLHWGWILLGVFVICGCGGVGLLGAILFPVFAQARLKAQQVTCIGNVRTLGEAASMYAADHDDRLPLAANWMDALRRDVGSSRNFSCPAISRPNTFGPRVSGKYGYAVNKALVGKSTKTIQDSAKEIWIFETGDLSRNASGDPGASAPPNRHGPGRTEGYGDGHAAFVKSTASPSGSR